ncbi:hypothetical protein [Actinacidiphila epipremni]|uniref:Sortase n=1 Tax=Actinacidiphila epipremni TaxID=2053013 RepID=A0ABX0ZKF0_9ACTN|nr:hypothetical protein [Actinacidiphila epipremni]NJP42684.1 hypothetical protein [Actinacidiphila epipremni]
MVLRRLPRCVRAVPAALLAAAAVLTGCGHPQPHPHASADAVRPAGVRAPAADTAGAGPAADAPGTPGGADPADGTGGAAGPGGNLPLPYAASAPPTLPPATAAPPRKTATPAARTPAAPPQPPPPRTTAPRAPARAAATPRPSGTAYPPGTTVLHIGTWERPVVRGDQATIDRCTSAVLFAGPDPLRADGYTMKTSVIVGHDYCGYAILAPLRIGTHVTLDTPQGTLSYHVYANYITPGQGGPDSGLYWGDLTLQTCVGPDTGFSYLMRD